MRRPLTVESHVLRPLSFRDPSGFVLTDGERIWRVVDSAAWDDLLCFLASNTFRIYRKADKIVGTRVIDKTELPFLPHDLRGEQSPAELPLRLL